MNKNQESHHTLHLQRRRWTDANWVQLGPQRWSRSATKKTSVSWCLMSHFSTNIAYIRDEQRIGKGKVRRRWTKQSTHETITRFTNLTMRQRCVSMRGLAALTSVTDAELHSRSATALARGLQHHQRCLLTQINITMGFVPRPI